jgi:hypothetical protein
MVWKLPASAIALLLAGAAAPADVFVVTGDRTFDAKIGGTSARLRVNPGAVSMPILNPDFAERARLVGTTPGMAARVGPMRLPGEARDLVFDIGRGRFTRLAAWFGRPLVTDADGAIGPGGLPMAVVRFDLRAPAPGERSVALPLTDFGRSGIGALVTVGGKRLMVRFSPERARTIVTASAGAVIAGARGGVFDAPPEPMRLHFGIERPVRHMTLSAPLTIGPLALRGLFVRTADFGSAGTIPDAAVDVDPDEVVVTGAKKPPSYRLEIGRDYLDRCSSITFDKRAKSLTLSCR